MTSAYTDSPEVVAELKRKPVLAWPTIILQVTAQATLLLVWYFALSGSLALWLGCIFNTVAYYAMFTPAHDAMHKSISSKGWVNDVALWVLSNTFIPGNSGKFLGLMHMQHHRFTNDHLDPDHALVANRLNIFYLWFFWDFRYIYFYARHKASFPAYSSFKLWWEVCFGLGLVAFAAYFYPLEVLLLWFVPTRLMVWLICLVFMYLPHVPHNKKQSDTPYQATLIRVGWDWLLTPLMMYQNYHLVHHLYPTIPFYRYKKAWNARKAFHEAQNPAKVGAFKLQPYNLNI